METRALRLHLRRKPLPWRQAFSAIMAATLGVAAGIHVKHEFVVRRPRRPADFTVPLEIGVSSFAC